MIEINLARGIIHAAYSMLPAKNGQGEREDLATALACIAIEHASAVLLLFANGSLASGYALMRPALEATYKCIWIATVADDKKVARACSGCDVYGNLKNIICEIEDEFKDTGWAATFGRIKPHVRALHERTHSGAAQTLRRLKSPDMRNPEYDLGEIVRDIRTLAGAAIIAAVPVVTMDNAGKLNALLSSNYSWLAQASGPGANSK